MTQLPISSKRSFPTGPLRENGVSEDGIAILQEMMKPYPSDRLTVREHPWVNTKESMLMKATLLSVGGMEEVPTGKDAKYTLGEESAIADLRLPPKGVAACSVRPVLWMSMMRSKKGAPLS